MKLKLNSVFAAVGAILISPPSFAESVPRYDPDAFCKDVAQFSGGSSVIYSGCIDSEQASYNNLKEAWPSLPDTVRSYCDDVARYADGSYVILEGCVEQEIEAALSQKQFKF